MEANADIVSELPVTEDDMNPVEIRDDINKYCDETKKCWKDRLDSKLLTEDMSGLSKNQQKKLLKKRLFQEKRMEKRKQERERKKVKRAELKEAGLPVPKRMRNNKQTKHIQLSGLKVAVDLDYFELMNDNDQRMVVKQVKTCYSENRRMEQPLQLYVTSFCNQFKDLFLSLQPGCVNWNVSMEESNYLDLFGAEKIVYLTSESENVLRNLETDKVYIIGGLVDHNQQKGLCYKLAKEKGVAHAQLPIEQYVQVNSRKVLTINHVFEILLRYHESKDWKDAFFKVLPKRKGVTELNEEQVEGGMKTSEDEQVNQPSADNISQ